MRTPAVPAGAAWGRVAIAAAGGLVAAGAFPPFDVGILVLVGLAPLLWLWERAEPARAALLGFAWGVPFFAAVLYWLFYFGAVAIVPLVAALAGTVALTGAAVAALSRLGVRSVWLTAAIWTLVEMIRGRFPLGGLPWADVGVALVDVGLARDLARWGGGALVTFVALLLVGAVVVAMERAVARVRDARALDATAALTASVALLVVAGVTAGVGPETGELRFALVQGNDRNRDLTTGEMRARHLPVTHFALAEDLDGDYDLIVFPESSMDGDPRVDPFLVGEIERTASEHDSYVLSNAGVFEDDGNSYNTNFLHAPDGRLVGSYAKQQLVPFGEYVPFEDLVGWIPAVDQVPSDFSPGDEMEVFDVRGVPVGTLICFENAFPDITRGAVRDGAEVLVVSTNNRSYRRSSNPAQHVNLSRMRAAETGRPVLHASISGITAVIEPDGSVVARSELFVNSVTEGTVVGRDGETPYVRYGSWIAVVCLAIVGGATLVGLRRRRAARPEPAVDSSTV